MIRRTVARLQQELEAARDSAEVKTGSTAPVTPIKPVQTPAQTPAKAPAVKEVTSPEHPAAVMTTKSESKTEVASSPTAAQAGVAEPEEVSSVTSASGCLVDEPQYDEEETS